MIEPQGGREIGEKYVRDQAESKMCDEMRNAAEEIVNLRIC